MPWSARDAASHNKDADTKKKKKVWASVANQQLAEHGDEGRAIRVANHAVSQMKGDGDWSLLRSVVEKF